MRKSRIIHVGKVPIGGGSPVVVQSMTNTDTRDAAATLDQIGRLAQAGCELVRLAVPDNQAALSLKTICAASPIPVIADIHFDYRLALAAVEAGVGCLRINPGNIGGKDKVGQVVRAAKAHRVPIRIGVNAGSLEKRLLEANGGPTPAAMAESALNHVRILEELDFKDIKISLKASSVPLTVASYRLLAGKCDYPLHVGITEAGTLFRGVITSAVGIGILLEQGLGDTIRVSLTDDPVREVEAAWQILSALELRQRGPKIISCPTCGRTEIDLIGLAKSVEERLRHVPEVFTVAVMGCIVNGPGEAREADVGIAGGRGRASLFRKGRIVRTLSGGREEFLEGLMGEIETFLAERSAMSGREAGRPIR